MSTGDEPFGECPPVDDGGFSSSYSPPDQNGEDFESTDGPILPPPFETEDKEGFALREWRRQNAIRLEEKEKEEKEKLQEILEVAEEYKKEFYEKRQSASESNKAANREKEKVFLENREKFHAEAEKNYWKAIPELIPREVAAIEKRGKKKDEAKKQQPSIVVIQGPKPGKPTELSRMRQILLKLKHNTLLHMNPKPPEPEKDPKPVTPGAASSSGNATAPAGEVVADSAS